MTAATDRRRLVSRALGTALEIAAWPTKDADARNAATRTIPRQLIAQLRRDLEALGVDWETYRDKTTAERREVQARQGGTL